MSPDELLEELRRLRPYLTNETPLSAAVARLVDIEIERAEAAAKGDKHAWLRRLCSISQYTSGAVEMVTVVHQPTGWSAYGHTEDEALERLATELLVREHQQ